MDRIRLIASDMDATLLDGHSQLPPDFLHLVQELAGQDILFAAASGRPLYKLEEMFAPVLEQFATGYPQVKVAQRRRCALARQRPVRLPHGAGGLAPADGLRGGKRGFLCGLRAGERLPAPL